MSELNLQSLMESLTWTLLHSLWQYSLIAVVVAVLLVVLRQSTANTRYLVCCAALSAMLGASLLTFSLHENATSLVASDVPTSSSSPMVSTERAARAASPRFSAVTDGDHVEPAASFLPSRSVDHTRSVSSPATAPTVQPLDSWIQRRAAWIVALWALGAITLGLWHGRGWLSMTRLTRHGVAAPPLELSQRFQRLCSEARCRSVPRLLQSVLVEVPVVIGWWRPVVLVPTSMITGVSTSQLDAILSHELAHIRRHDYLVNLLQTAAETLMFYHPAVWWVSRQVRIEREYLL